MNEEKKVKTTTYYYLEVSQEVYDLLQKGCKTIEQLMCGNLEEIQRMAFNAYEKRTGMAVPPDMERNIKDCIKGLEAWGWNKPIENTIRFSEESDTYRDICDVLDHQKKILGMESQSEGLPPHYNKAIPMVRIINVVESGQKRTKPLKTFVDCKSKKRRI